MQIKKIYQLKGKIQHYAWGGYDFIPGLLGADNNEHVPCAEYWMGIHPLAPSVIIDDSNEILLSEKAAPDSISFLLKILDVREMLSIQVHPSKAAAEKGFDEEEKRGIPLNASSRNYKDRNDKPEMMLALSEFWLLHGFKTEDKTEHILNSYNAFTDLLPFFKEGSYRSLFQHIMNLPQEEVNTKLLPLVKEEMQKKTMGLITREDAGWWVCKLFEGRDLPADLDRGIFSLYLLNIVHLHPGEAIFQGAGLIHAYLEGQNLELMTNSDNVLRGGLTPKHIDVHELLLNTKFEATIPSLIQKKEMGHCEYSYPVPVDSFALNRIELAAGGLYISSSASPEIWFCMNGHAEFYAGNSIEIRKGASAFIPAETDFSVHAAEACTLYRVSVPVQKNNSL